MFRDAVRHMWAQKVEWFDRLERLRGGCEKRMDDQVVAPEASLTPPTRTSLGECLEHGAFEFLRWLVMKRSTPSEEWPDVVESRLEAECVSTW